MKVPNHIIDDAMEQEDIWVDEFYELPDSYWQEYFGDLERGDMSWQWYMEVSIRRREGWQHLIISPDYKNITVKNWLEETYPNCMFKFERNHFLIKEHDVATMMALKWT